MSAGALRFEVQIYRHDLENGAYGASGRQREKLKLVDSIDTCGMEVLRIVELSECLLLVMGQYCKIKIYYRRSEQSKVDKFKPNADFSGMLTKCKSLQAFSMLNQNGG